MVGVSDSAPEPGSTEPVPRRWSANLPASGGWKPGQDPGDLQFLQVATDRPLALEGGGILHDITVGYETWGELNASADNAVLVCHALTGDAHAGCLGKPTKGNEGWWQDFIGPGLAIDTDRFYVVCANVLGGCQGSTGPASINPETGEPYGPDFPTVTIRDMVRVQARLATALGVDEWLAVVGGSMGGMQVLEWGVMFPERVRAIAPVATTLAASAWQIALSAVGRVTITLDPNWRGGRYYDAGPGEGPHAGLATARAIAQITYKSDEVFQQRFGRALVDPVQVFGAWDRFQIESYLDYHGEKLVQRFDANSYIVVNRAMDLHDVGRGRGSITRAVERIKAPVFTASISSDTLYHPHLQAEIAGQIRAAGGYVEYDVIESPAGHDGFLIEGDKLGPPLGDFLDRVAKGALG